MSAVYTGRFVVVSNAQTAQGRRICQAFGRTGATVCVGADSADSVASVLAELHSQQILAEGWVMDPARVDSANDLVAEVDSRFGLMDVWVNCHVLTPSAPAESLPLADFVNGLHLNLDAMFFNCQVAARYMLAKPDPGGIIINVTSVAAVVALPGHAAFCAAMAGINASTKTLAVEWGAHNIRVVGLGAGITPEMAEALSVHPPLPDARPAHRRLPPLALASADSLGEAAVYLASDAARHISGMTLYADGGWLSDGYWEPAEAY